jgi:transcriptional regulator with XRE-family HTH domain
MSKQLKYRLVEFKEMNKLTYKAIATFCQVTERQVVTWAQIEKNAPASISADKLRMLSELFSCSMEAMYNKEELVPA